MAMIQSESRCVTGPRRQRGAVAIMVAFVMMLLLMFAALAVDSFHLVVVRNELQNDTDAAALAGASFLWQGPAMPNLALAEEKGLAAISLNKSFRANLVSGDVDAGYWSLDDGFSAGAMANPGVDHIPALRVTVARSGGGGVMGEGSNGGAVELFLGGVVGTPSVDVSATSVAVVAPPGMIFPGSLFPMVLTKCLFDNYWDAAAGRPKNDPVTNQPYIFRIGSNYHYGPCESGQWTSFQLDDNNTPTIRGLIDEGNAQSIEIGDTTWLQPGTKTSLFDYVNDCSAAGTGKCEYETVPIITSNVVDVHARMPVGAFACVRILGAVGGSDKYITVQMSNGCLAEGGGSGQYYGTTLPPKLAQ